MKHSLKISSAILILLLASSSCGWLRAAGDSVEAVGDGAGHAVEATGNAIGRAANHTENEIDEAIE